MVTWKKRNIYDIANDTCMFKLLSVCKKRYGQKGIDLPSQLCGFCDGADEVAQECQFFTIDPDASLEIIRDMAVLQAEVEERKRRMEELT